MADALVERRPPARFFCHRCNIEFENALQVRIDTGGGSHQGARFAQELEEVLAPTPLKDLTCPYCASGFIEELEEPEAAGGSGDEFSDADMSNLDDMTTIDEMSNLDDSDDMPQSTPPMLNDLAFLMSGGRRQILMEQLMWIFGGARGGTVAAGAPFVLVGAPGDYVFGGEGLDAVVTQLLGQLENAGPPPLPREQINQIPSEAVTAEQAANIATCSVCWDVFQVGEMVSRLECDHIFHTTCISPWLQLHATCPICRRSLLPEDPAPPPVVDASPSRDGDRETGSNNSNSAPHSESSTTSLPRVVLRRIARRSGAVAAGGAGGTGGARAAGGARWGDSSSSSSMDVGSSGTEWAHTEPTSPRSTASSRSTNSSSSLHSSAPPGPHLNMDIDFD